MEPGSEEQAHSLTSAEYEAEHGRLPAIIGTFTGGSFHVLDPRPCEVRIEDIAHALGMIGRYTGHCRELWSVGAHCLEVAARIKDDGGSPYEQLCGLLHDASEAYLVDIPRPFKPDTYFRVGRATDLRDRARLVPAYESYYQAEDRVQRAIFAAYHIPFPEATSTAEKVVKRVDDSIVYDEVANFFSPGFMWERYTINQPKHNLVSLVPAAAEQLYLRRFHLLLGLR